MKQLGPTIAMATGENDCPACNLCGLSCRLGDGPEIGGLINAVVRGGYYSTAGNGSGALDDGHSYKFSLCEWCLDWLFSQFTIPVKAGSYHLSNEPEPSWRPAWHRVTEDTWRTYESEFFNEYNKRNEARHRIIK